jgi:iron(III) transport system substrate-binding protein
MVTRHRSPTRLLSTLLLPVALAAVLPACGGSSEGAVTVYSGRSEDLVGPLLEQFAEETGTDIEVRYGDSTELALLIAEEGEDTPADLFISQSPGAVAFLDREGLLGTVSDDALQRIPEGYRAADGSWVGLSGRRRALVYNEDDVDPADLPDSVLDLTDAVYEGQVGIAPSNASFQDFVTAMRAELGDEATLEWLEGMAANGAPVYQNNVSIVEAVGRGEIPMGLVNHYYNAEALAEDPDLPSRNHFFPGDDLGAMVLVAAGSILAGNDAGEDADALLEFLLSDESQRYFAEETFEYPLVEGVDPVADLPPLEGLSVAAVDYDSLGGGLETTLELIDESGIST